MVIDLKALRAYNSVQKFYFIFLFLQILLNTSKQFKVNNIANLRE